MNNEEIIAKLNNLNDAKLIDVFKNYDNYGYSVEIKEMAKVLLDKRGYTDADLEISPSIDRNVQQYLRRLYASFKRNSMIAFLFFGLFLVAILLLGFASSDMLDYRPVFGYVFWITLLLYIVFVIRAFISQYRFDRLTKKEGIVDGLLIFFFLCVPFYFLMYVRWSNQMQETLSAQRSS